MKITFEENMLCAYILLDVPLMYETTWRLGKMKREKKKACVYCYDCAHSVSYFTPLIRMFHD